MTASPPQGRLHKPSSSAWTALHLLISSTCSSLSSSPRDRVCMAFLLAGGAGEEAGRPRRCPGRPLAGLRPLCRDGPGGAGLHVLLAWPSNPTAPEGLLQPAGQQGSLPSCIVMLRLSFKFDALSFQSIHDSPRHSLPIMEVARPDLDLLSHCPLCSRIPSSQPWHMKKHAW